MHHALNSLRLCSLVALLCGARPVYAMNCTIHNTAQIVFGEYMTREDRALDTTGSVSYECDDVGTADMITITLGRSDHGAFFPRRMAYRSSQLEYNLYVDAARTRVWGDGTSGTSVYSARPLEGRPTAIPIFARIPARQNVLVGTYADSVTLTILF
jgi:spore coat protein U-like protein